MVMLHSSTYDQCLTHAHSHITSAVAGMDSSFALIRPHQHGISIRHQTTQKPYIRHPLLLRQVQRHPFKCQPHTIHV